MKSPLCFALAISFAVIFAGCGYFLGDFRGEQRIKMNRFRDENSIFNQGVSGKGNWKNIVVEMNTYDGSIYLSGNVDSEQDLANLGRIIIELYGLNRGSDMLKSVDIRK